MWNPLLDYFEDDLTSMIREDRLASEFCGCCWTRHHPQAECQEDWHDTTDEDYSDPNFAGVLVNGEPINLEEF